MLQPHKVFSRITCAPAHRHVYSQISSSSQPKLLTQDADASVELKAQHKTNSGSVLLEGSQQPQARNPFHLFTQTGKPRTLHSSSTDDCVRILAGLAARSPHGICSRPMAPPRATSVAEAPRGCQDRKLFSALPW